MKMSLLSSVARPAFAVMVGSSLAVGVACSAGGNVDKPGITGSGNPGSGGSINPGSGGTSTGSGAGTGTGGSVIIMEPDASPDGRAPRCDDAGNCTCINVGVLGRPRATAPAGRGRIRPSPFRPGSTARAARRSI